MEEKKKFNYNPKSLKNLKPIQKGQVLNPHGRPKNMIRKVIDEFGELLNVKLSKTDVMSVISIMNNMSVADLTRIANDNTTPAFIVVIANGILGDIKNKNLNNTQFMLEFQHGKAIQGVQLEAKISEEVVNPKIMSDDEIRRRLTEIRERDIEERDFEEVV